MKKQNFMLDAIVVGLALFSTFFGAGNLIFPPAVGLESGSAWVMGALGLLLSAIIFPVLSILAVNNAGNGSQGLMIHAHRKLYNAMSILGWLFIGVGSSVPRCGATTHELGVVNLFPNVSIWVTVIVFFVLVFFFAKDRDSIVDKLGKYLTPLLIIMLAIVLSKGIASPVGEPIEPQVDNPFTSAMLQGYAIGDLLLGLMCANIFIYSMRAKGYGPKLEKRGITIACLVCIAIMSCIYVCLTYIGATGSSIYPQGTAQTVLLSGLINLIMGKFGLACFGIAVALACLTTAITMAATIADLFSGLCKGRIGYKMMLVITCVVCGLIATLGVSSIIDYVTPIFLTLYPPFIVLTILGLLDKIVPNDGLYKGGVFTALVIGALEGIYYIFPGLSFIGTILSYIPFYSYGFTWVVPSVIAMVIGGIVCRNRPRQYYTEDVLEAKE